ncbi:uncharacterized protein LOC121281373 isoform X3 [Carcharodon carcharias]|uniref:uncharacterized protein LOC121281373 isoform X3 n=1 Tax=Carcharodon carcharias TaxID=13397 RepID=UPI001B7EEB83|nr:uncharacterized protein LOC121281373 isoform X3 [Carcharodon carcharias]
MSSGHCTLQNFDRLHKTQINELTGKLSKSFSEWRRKLGEDEEFTPKLIDEEGFQVLSQIRSCSELLNKRMEQITLIDDETQSLVKKDPLSFIQNSMQLLSRVTETETVTGPDVPVLALNLSNISQLIQKRLNGWEKCHSDILEIIMPAYTEYRGPRKVTLFPTQLLWGSPYPTEHPPAVDRDQESRSIPREKVIEPGSKDSKLQLGSV